MVGRSAFLLQTSDSRPQTFFWHHLENFGEARDDAVFDFGERDFAAQDFFHRGHRLALASDDEVEVGEVCANVQGEAVRRHPTCDMDADGGDLAALCVDACESLYAERLDAEVEHRAHQHFFKVA